MISYSKLKSMCLTYPNDSQLGAFVRSLYFSEERAQQLITEGTSVTSLDEQMEEAHSILEDENRFPGNKKTDYTIHGYDANGSPADEYPEEIDITSAYTKNPHPRTGI